MVPLEVEMSDSRRHFCNRCVFAKKVPAESKPMDLTADELREAGSFIRIKKSQIVFVRAPFAFQKTLRAGTRGSGPQNDEIVNFRKIYSAADFCG